MVMMVVLAASRWRERKDHVTRSGYTHPRCAHVQEGAPLGQALRDTVVGGKIVRTSVKYCAPDVGGCAFPGCHSCDWIVDLQIRSFLPHKGAAPGQASMLRCVLQREGVSVLGHAVATLQCLRDCTKCLRVVSFEVVNFMQCDYCWYKSK